MSQLGKLKRAAPCTHRWDIYASFVVHASQELASINRDYPFAATALGDYELLTPLVQKLDLLTASAVSKDLAQLRGSVLTRLSAKKTRLKPLSTRGKKSNFSEQNPQVFTLDEINEARSNDAESPRQKLSAENQDKGYRHYFRWIVNAEFWMGEGQASVRGVDSFLEHYKSTRHFLQKVTTNFIENTRLAVSRIAADREKIATVFFGPKTSILEMVKITDSGSDTHKGGKSVLFVDFKVRGLVAPSDVNQRIIYKPSDMELDYRMCGDTHKFNAYAPIGRMDSLAEWVNHHVSRADSDDTFRLPTYTILPVNPGSTVSSSVSDRLRHENSYGYVEFLTRYPGMQADGLPDVTTEHTEAGTDWLCTQPEAREFFRIWGGWLAIARIFSWGDMHAENVIASRKKPMPIDLEAGFSGPMTSLVDTQVVGAKYAPHVESSSVSKNGEAHAQKGPKDRRNFELKTGLGGLTGKSIPVFKTPVVNEGTVFLSVGQEMGEENTSNRVVVGEDDFWVRAHAGEHIPVIIESMKKVLSLFASNNDALLYWTNSISRCVARFVPTPTGRYQVVLAAITGTSFSDSDPEARLWEFIAKYETGFESGSVKARLSSDNHDYRDFMNHDIPYYCHRLSDRALFNARGVCVHKEYFVRPTFDDVIQQIKQTTNQAWIKDVLVDAALVIAGRSREGVTGLNKADLHRQDVKEHRVKVFELLTEERAN